MINALAHVVVTEGLDDEAFVRSAANPATSNPGRGSIAEERNSPEATAANYGVDPRVRAAAPLYATRGNRAIYSRLRVAEPPWLGDW